MPAAGGPRPDSGIELSHAEIVRRWSTCWQPDEVARHLAGVAALWCVAGGWALDLFRGEQSRPHADLEIGVPAAAFPEIRDRFPELAVDAVGAGRIWPEAGPERLAGTHQTWLRDPGTGNYRLDVFREPHDGDIWICRHDRRIRLPYDRVVHRTADRIPYLAPELVLLFKARRVRAKDQNDFDATLPSLSPRQRRALAGWLAASYPGHDWLDAL